MKLTHKQAQRLLEEQANGRIFASAQEAHLDAHLSSCAQCRRYASDLAVIDDRLTAMLKTRWPNPPRQDLALVMHKVRKTEGRQVIMKGALNSMKVLAVLVLIVVLWVWRGNLQIFFVNNTDPAAGAPDAESGATATPVPSPTYVPTATPIPVDDRLAVEETAVTASPVPPAPAVTPTATPVPAPATTVYRVAFVAADDMLYVRQEAGVTSPVVGALPPDTGDILVTGVGETVSGSTWLPVTSGQVSGWVNSRFLTEALPAAGFCQDDAVAALLSDFETAVRLADDTLLASLIHPERGLRVRYHWWNPEVLLRDPARSALFSDNTVFDWGVHDGSGAPIVGAFAAEIVPLLHRDFVGALEQGCNEILEGGSAGFVKLPEGYDALNYYSFYRPAVGEENAFSWGTWVVGVERWNGRYYLSYLVHFDWEI